MSSQDDFSSEWSPLAAERLKAAIARAGRQEDIARAAGLSRSGLAAILNGSTNPRLASIERLCAVLGIEKRSLFEERAQSSSTQLEIKEIDLAYGMGATWTDGVPVTEKSISFPTEWVRQFSKSPAEALFFARGAGDSMMPTILDGDIVLVDTMQKTPTMADRIWVLTWGGMGMIKRLRGDPEGGLKLLSDNPSVPPETAYDGEANIIGRVVAIIRKV